LSRRRPAARDDRRHTYDKTNEQDLTGSGPNSGVRIDYVQSGYYVVIYWDDEGSLVSGDLYSTTIDRPALEQIWDRYVG
jgi:hypothetical protein